MSSERPCIVIHTNVLISAGLLPNSTSAKVLTLAVSLFAIAQNEATWHELETRIARPKFDRYFGEQGRVRHLAEIARNLRAVPSVADEHASVDASDDKFLSLALDAGADLIISGDLDLKEIRTHKGVEIVSPAMFLARFGG